MSMNGVGRDEEENKTVMQVLSDIVVREELKQSVTFAQILDQTTISGTKSLE